MILTDTFASFALEFLYIVSFLINLYAFSDCTTLFLHPSFWNLSLFTKFYDCTISFCTFRFDICTNHSLIKFYTILFCILRLKISTDLSKSFSIQILSFCILCPVIFINRIISLPVSVIISLFLASFFLPFVQISPNPIPYSIFCLLIS